MAQITVVGRGGLTVASLSPPGSQMSTKPSDAITTTRSHTQPAWNIEVTGLGENLTYDLTENLAYENLKGESH